MFTFGREHELKCAIASLKSEADIRLITQVVNAVHDLIEGESASISVRSAIVEAFTLGGSGVWEQAGAWLRRLSGDNPEMLDIWRELSTCDNARARFRVACFLNEMPLELAFNIGDQLKRDTTRKAREMAEARLEEISQSSGDSGQ